MRGPWREDSDDPFAGRGGRGSRCLRDASSRRPLCAPLVFGRHARVRSSNPPWLLVQRRSSDASRREGSRPSCQNAKRESVDGIRRALCQERDPAPLPVGRKSRYRTTCCDLGTRLSKGSRRCEVQFQTASGCAVMNRHRLGRTGAKKSAPRGNRTHICALGERSFIH